MSSKPPRLRGKGKARNSPYPLGEFTDAVVNGVGRLIVHRLAVGHANITGDDFAEIFASAIGGVHRHQPLGVTDVVWNGCSWSAKTVQSKNPHKQPSIRLISGRNSPSYSYDMGDPRKNIEKTGQAVLNIWNERVNQSFHDHDDLRIVVMMRNIESLEFTLFEYEASRYTPADFEWRLNSKNNLEGFDKVSGEHHFTWQPHGSQFTVIKEVPGSACKFKIVRSPSVMQADEVLALVEYDDSWIERVT